jgi:type I restriction enzyme R subunit
MFNEASYENAVISLLEGLGYEHKYGPDIERDYHNPLCMDVLPEQLAAINPGIKFVNGFPLVIVELKT